MFAEKGRFSLLPTLLLPLLWGCGQDPPFPAPRPDDCISDVSAGHHRFTCGDMVHDVSVPASCLQKPCGLVVDVHGAMMSAQMEDNNTGMRALGEQHGTVVYQPNAGMPVPELNITLWVPGQDDEKILDFIRRAIRTFHLDPDRIHMTGFSAGGYLTWRFVCGHSDLLASAAPAGAGAKSGAGVENCTPPTDVVGDTPGCSFSGDEIPDPELDILFMNGVRDALHQFPCAVSQRDAVVQAWRMDEGEVLSRDPGHTWTRYKNAAGTVLEFIEHEYQAAEKILGGHCYPGSPDLGPALEEGQYFAFGCQDPDTFAWGQAVMDFFVAHPRGR